MLPDRVNVEQHYQRGQPADPFPEIGPVRKIPLQIEPRKVKETIPTVSASVTVTANPHSHHSRPSIRRISAGDAEESCWFTGGIACRIMPCSNEYTLTLSVC